MYTCLPLLCCGAQVCAAACASNEDGERLCVCGSSLSAIACLYCGCSAQLYAAAYRTNEDGERLCVRGSSLSASACLYCGCGARVCAVALCLWLIDVYTCACLPVLWMWCTGLCGGSVSVAHRCVQVCLLACIVLSTNKRAVLRIRRHDS